jgi:hypothetical protein
MTANGCNERHHACRIGCERELCRIDDLADERIGYVVLNALFGYFTREMIGVVVLRIIRYSAADANCLVQKITKKGDCSLSGDSRQDLHRARQKVLVHSVAKERGQPTVLFKHLEQRAHKSERRIDLTAFGEIADEEVRAFQDMYGSGLLPQNGAYAVAVTPSQACAVSVSSKSTTGFTVTLTPPSSGTIAAGTIDILVHS